jgi:hypothetical protein
MSQTAVLVWLSAASALPTFHADLSAFAQSRLLRLQAPPENTAGFHASAYAPDVVEQLESALEEARNATASLEQNRALGALEHVDQLLREHPELPQSAWLMAEAWQLSADVESSAGGDASAAALLRMRAAALEGPRAAPFSDRPEESAAEALPTQAVRINGLEPGDTLQWDGVDAPTAEGAAMTVTTVAGEHHARVLRHGRLMWAGWSKLGAQDAQLALPVPETTPCSADDVGGGYFSAGHAIAAAHARCESYVLARPRAAGGIEAALCEREHCGGVVIWTRTTAPTPVQEAPKKVWPYVVAISGAALAVTGLILWRVGAFDRPSAGTTSVWVLNPSQKQMGLRF